jgi:hypothetical protein
MAITPTIVSPGIELVETDESVRASTSSGTTVYIPGFAQQGPTDEVTYISSLEDFEQIFGYPTTAAERYFYATVSQVLQSTATVAVTRLPYGADSGDTKSPQYTLLAYPAIGFAIDQEHTFVEAGPDQRMTKKLYAKDEAGKFSQVTTATSRILSKQYYTDIIGTKLVDFSTPVTIYTLSGATYIEVTDEQVINTVFKTYYVEADIRSYKPLEKFSDGSEGVDGEYVDSATYLIGEPVQFNISLEEYYHFLNNRTLDNTADFDWSDEISPEVSTKLSDLGKFAFITLNVGKTVTNDTYEGYYLALSDNAFSDPGTTYAAVRKLKTVTDLTDDNTIGLTASDYTTVPTERLDFKLSSSLKGCISQIMEESITSFDISEAQWNDTLNIGVFKLRQSTSTGDALKLAAVIYEGYNASFEYGRKTTSKLSTTAVDFFVENTSASSSLINVFVNPYLSGSKTSRGLYPNGSPKIKMRVYAQQLGDIALTDTQMQTLAISDLMDEAAGISKEAFDSIEELYPTFKFADSMYPIGLYAKADNTSKLIGNVPAKVENALNLIENDELYDIDLLLEAGLGTIYVGAMDQAYQAYNTKLAAAKELDEARGDNRTEEAEKIEAKYPYGYIPESTLFDDSKIIEGVTDLRTGKSSLSDAAETVITNLRAVQSEFLKVASSQQDGGRGDVFFVGDTLRQIAVEGRDNKIEKQFGKPLTNAAYTSSDGVVHSFSTSIYWPLRHLYDGITSSYMAIYPYFLKVADTQNATQFWAPSSGAVASKMASADAKYGPWQAGAGFNNGILSSVLDISFSTNQRQRDDLYKISLNPIISSPSNGIAIWGIRTFIKKDSSFDQITCRRTFLYIEKILRKTAKNFLFEGNTDYTRLLVTNTMTPVFDSLVNNRALYDYVFICDTRNNTDEVIDEGNLVMDFYGSAVRTAERILISTHATRSGTITTEFDA